MYRDAQMPREALMSGATGPSNRTGSSILVAVAQEPKIDVPWKVDWKWWPGTESNFRHGDFQNDGLNNYSYFSIIRVISRSHSYTMHDRA
jgi:hypothetical protein